MSPNQALEQARIEHQCHIFVTLLKGTPLPLGYIVPERRPTMILSRKKSKLYPTPVAPLASQEAA